MNTFEEKKVFRQFVGRIFHANQIKSNQIKSNQIKSNQIKSNQIKSNQIKRKSEGEPNVEPPDRLQSTTHHRAGSGLESRPDKILLNWNPYLIKMWKVSFFWLKLFNFENFCFLKVRNAQVTFTHETAIENNSLKKNIDIKLILEQTTHSRTRDKTPCNTKKFKTTEFQIAKIKALSHIHQYFI